MPLINLTEEELDTINAALYFLRGSDKTEMHGNQLERIDAALEALTRQPVGVWEPVESWSSQERMSTKPESRVINTTIKGRIIEMEEHDRRMATLLPQNMAVCRLSPQPAAAAVPQPDWSKAPAWAQWWAVGANGDGHWYENEPYLVDWEWDWANSKGLARMDDCICIPIGIDWRTTLRRRPTPGASGE